MTMHRYRFTVMTGGFPFPLDMLRYDACYPASGADVSKIQASIEQEGRNEPASPISVTLCHYDESRKWEPTAGRWQSFLWSVDRQSLERF